MPRWATPPWQASSQRRTRACCGAPCATTTATLPLSTTTWLRFWSERWAWGVRHGPPDLRLKRPGARLEPTGPCHTRWQNMVVTDLCIKGARNIAMLQSLPRLP